MSDQKTETLGPDTKEPQEPIRPVPKLWRWGEGFSPQELMDQIMEEVDDVSDLVIVVKYDRTTSKEDSYNVVSSTMSMHELLGLIELGKLMSISTKRVDMDDGDEAS